MTELKTFRKINNLTQTEIGEYLGIKKAFVSSIENGKARLPVEKFNKLINNDRGWDITPLTSESTYLNGIHDNAKPEALVEGRLNYRRRKTGKLYSVKVEPEAMDIIDRYRGKDHLLEAMDNHDDFLSWRTQLNKRLKSLGQTTGKRGKIIGEGPFHDLSTYWTRHTWSTLAFQIGIPVDTIAQALGHSDRSHSVTFTYIKTDQRRVDEANRKLIDFVNGISPSGNRTQDDK